MYHMKTIVPTEDNITLPQCMYYLKNPNNYLRIDETDINISDQVKRFLKESPNGTMLELEHRQSQLLQKLDVLYERIKAISKLCTLNIPSKTGLVKVETLANAKEIVVILNPEIVPCFMNIFLKAKHALHVTWHIHSSVPSKKALKIKEYFNNKKESYRVVSNAEINIRLIFKCVSASAELRVSSLEVPLLGIVNILRYLCSVYPNVIPYKENDFYPDSLLDQCHLLEKTSKKRQEDITTSLFAESKNWIYEDEFSVVDLAAFIIIRWQNITKSVPKSWYAKCQKMLL